MWFPTNTSQGEEILREDNFNRCFNFLFFFFQMTISLLPYLLTFSRELYFRKSYFFTLHQSNYIDTTDTFLEKLFLHSSCLFFEKLRFWKSHFLVAVIFSEYVIFRSEVSTNQRILENRKFFRTVTFRNTYFFSGGIDLEKIFFYLKKSSFFEASASAQHQLFQES